MNSIQHLHCLLFSISLLLSIILSVSSMSSTALPTPDRVTTITTPSTEMSSSLDQNSTASTMTSTSLTTNGTITTETPSSISQAGTSVTTVINPSPTQDSSTDQTTTLLTSAITPTDASNTTSNSSSNGTTTTLMPSSVSVSTSQSAETTLTTTGTSNSTANTTIPVTHSSLPATTVNTTTVTVKQDPPLRLTQSEVYLTIIFGVLLAVTVLTVVGYGIRRCRQKNSQYIHQPLHNDSEEIRDNYSAPDDTLVISGGLYDGQGIFNPELTVNDDMGLHSDHPPFAPHPTQFRLEFLSEGPTNPTHCEAPTLETFRAFDAKD